MGADTVNSNINKQLPKKIAYTCKGCNKTIQVQSDIYKKVYEGKELCLSCRGTKK